MNSVSLVKMDRDERMYDHVSKCVSLSRDVVQYCTVDEYSVLLSDDSDPSVRVNNFMSSMLC